MSVLDIQPTLAIAEPIELRNTIDSLLVQRADALVVRTLPIHTANLTMAGLLFTHYWLLKVDVSADLSAITAAYRRLVRLYHPDTCAADDATERIVALNGAYTVLRNPKLRRAYDLSLGIAQAEPPAPTPVLQRWWRSTRHWFCEPIWRWSPVNNRRTAR